MHLAESGVVPKVFNKEIKDIKLRERRGSGYSGMTVTIEFKKKCSVCIGHKLGNFFKKKTRTALFAVYSLFKLISFVASIGNGNRQKCCNLLPPLHVSKLDWQPRLGKVSFDSVRAL